MKTHSIVKDYECEFCSKSFASEKALLNHELIHSEEKKHKCVKCDKAFAREANLMIHMKTHEEEPKPYSCSVCRKSFESEVMLLAHKALCLSGKPFRFMAYDQIFPQSIESTNLEVTENTETTEVVVTIEESTGAINQVEITTFN